jgi:hypothetical protein
VADDAALNQRFALLASAIAGHPMTVATHDGPAWTDGRVIWLPVDGVTRAHVLLQAALVRSGSLAPDVVRPLLGRADLGRRYLAIEGRRALGDLAELMPRSAIPSVDPLYQETVSTPQSSLALAQSRKRLPAPPAWFGVIKCRKALANADALTPAEAAQLESRLAEAREEAADGDEAGDEGAESSILKALSGVVGDNPIARALRRQLGGRSSSTSGASGSSGAPSVTVSRRGTNRGVVIERSGLAPDQQLSIFEPKLRLYPEWDAMRGTYKPDWCAVNEVVPSADEGIPLERGARHDGLRRELAPLGLALQRRRRQQDGFDLDIDAVIESVITTRSGHTASPNVYIDNRRQRRDLTALVLLDASGSATELNTQGTALYERQRDAAAGLIDTLAILGDRVAGYAFRSQGRDVAMIRIKGFDETFGEPAMARLGGIRPDGFTRMGAAIRHATSLLLADNATTYRALFVLSDGFPYDGGYEGRYAEADVNKALTEARESGVAGIGVNLGTGTDPAILSRVFGASLHASAPDIDHLAPVLRRLVVDALDQTTREARAQRQQRKAPHRKAKETAA